MKLSPDAPRRSRAKKDKGRASLRTVAGIALMGLLVLLMNVYSAQPDWWASRGVLDAQQVQDQNAVVNVGQLKAMAAKAMDEMDAKFPGGAGPAIHALVKDWRDHKLQHDQSAALNVGQLKAVAKLYYDRLMDVGARPANAGYPWPVNPPVADNYALVNAGQVKNVFSFAIPLIHDTDTDGDGMPDGWELAQGLNAAMDDSLEDYDGDRVPNVFEYKRNTLANDPNSTPMATFIVHPDLGALDATDNIYSTIKEALDQVTSLVNAYAVIEVKSGVYAELVLVNKAPVLLLGELGNIKGPPVIIGSLTSSAYAVYLSTASVLDGFIIKHTSARSGGGISVHAGTGSSRRRLINCIIRGNEASTGGGIYNGGAKLDVVHCTVTGNKGTSSGRGIYNSNASTLNLVNSIVWGNTGSAMQEIYKYPHTSSIVTVTGGSIPAVATSIVAYGEHGGINADPQLTPVGWLWSSVEFPSPAINRAGVALTSGPKLDIHGEPRPEIGTTPDLGADEFKDSNGDGLPDWLEGPDDNDGLAALVEYKVRGTNPLLKDTDGDGLSDDVEINQGTDPLDDFYHAQPPTLKFVGGGNQWGAAGTVLATPVSLSVNNGTLNAPVTFTASDGGLISADGVSNWQSSLSLFSNVTYNVPGGVAIKVAQVFVKLPEGIGSSSVISASVITGGKTVTTDTWAAAFDPALSPPTDQTATPTAPDTVRLNWTPSDLGKSTTIEISADGGATWSTVGVANAGDSYALITGLTPNILFNFRVLTGGIYTGSGGLTAFLVSQITTSPPSPGGSVSQPPASSVTATPVDKPTLFIEATSFLGTKWGYPGLKDKTNSYLTKYEDAETPWGAKVGDTREIDPRTGAETISNIVNTGNFVRDTLAGYMQGYDPGFTDTMGVKTVYRTLGDTSQVNYVEHVQLDKPNSMEDLLRHMEGVKNAAGQTVVTPWVPPFQNKFIQEIKPTPQNQYDNYAPGRATALINITYPKIADTSSGLTTAGGYELKKLQYKWRVNSDPNMVVNWLEVFTPYDGTAPIVTPKNWASEGKTESEVYIIDPSVRNDKKNGVYKIVKAELIAHRRGTIDKPGSMIPDGTGKYGYETVMLENADSDIEPTASKADYEKNETAIQANKDKDDDLVKVTIKYPKGTKISGASLELVHEGVVIDGSKANTAQAVATNGSSKLRFYDEQGKKLNPATDFKISDLENPPADVYLSKLITNGEISLFIEGASQFGYLNVDRAHLMGGSRLRLKFTNGQSTSDLTKLLVYRGGFLVYRQPANAPGTIGTLEFYDGKGRIHHRTGGKHNEFATDEWDMGTRQASWQGRSGKMTDGSQGAVGNDYDLTTKKNGNKLPCGHLPPGWWHVGPYKSISTAQDNQQLGDGTIKQGGYCRWPTDDVANPYEKPYRYDPTRDGSAPASIKYKFDLLAIKGTENWTRSGFQIHPDGEKNGTAGCIGIQSVPACKEVQKILRKFHGLKLRCVRE